LDQPDQWSGVAHPRPTLVDLIAQLDLPPRTILLVEDEAFVREVTYQILCSAGYRVFKALNAIDALLAFHQQGAVHLLLTDVVLPDRNGCDLASEITNSCPGVKTIFISGYPENSVTRKGLRAGCFYLPKPFSAVLLLRKITDVLENEACGSI